VYPEQNDQFYRFDVFTLDLARRRLLRDNRPVPLKPKAFDLLVALVESRGRVVTKEELLERVWPNQFVEEGNLTVHMSAVRKALGDRKGEARFVETIPGQGYSFLRRLDEAGDNVVIEQHTFSRVVVEEEGEAVEEEAEIGAAGRDAAATREAGAQKNSVDVGLAAQIEVARSSTLPQPLAEIDASPVRSHRKIRTSIKAGAIMGLVIGLVIAAASVYWYASRSGGERRSLFRDAASGPPSQMKVTRITNNGRVNSAAVSPDGKYVAYILGNALAGDSIHLAEAAAKSDAEVLSPDESSLGSITFAPDGDNLYFYREKKAEEGYCKMPVLGGAIERILPGIQGPIALSPDGKRVAFLEVDPEKRETALLLANTRDGGDQRKLAALAWPRTFTSDGLGWSPDGKVIAIGCFGDQRQQFTYLVGVRVADGAITPISSSEWGNIRDLEWLSDGSGLVMVAGDDEMVDANQVWLLHYPGGEARRITNDILRYGSDITLSSTSNELVVVATRLSTNIWVSPIADPSQARQVTFGAEGRFDGLYGLQWTPDEKIVYGAYVGYAQTIWIMNEDGAGPKQLTPGMRHISDSAVRVSADGRYVLFHSNRSGSSEIWRCDVNGEGPTQITTGGLNYQPAVSPDTKWVLYLSWEDGKPLLWKVPFGGGEPVRLTEKPGDWPSVSPDGKLIACGSEGKLLVIPFDGGPPVMTFDMPGTAMLFPSGAIWSPDASALLYRDTIQGIWRQPLAGGKAEKIPGLRPETVFNLALSADGQKLAITYGTQSSDAVLISHFR